MTKEEIEVSVSHISAWEGLCLISAMCLLKQDFFILQQLCLLEINTYLYKLKQNLYFSTLSMFVNSRKQISSCHLDVWGFLFLQRKPSLICFVAYGSSCFQQRSYFVCLDSGMNTKANVVIICRSKCGVEIHCCGSLARLRGKHKKACHLPCLGSPVCWENKSHGKCKWET